MDTSFNELRVIIIVTVNDIPPTNSKISSITASTTTTDTTEPSDQGENGFEIPGYLVILIFSTDIVGALSILRRSKREARTR
ncbi:hypothetical protein WKT22_02385 [Candidatus Lokiarchaeum ossiferum]